MASSAPNNSAEPARSVTVLDVSDGISMRNSDSGESVWRETLSAGGERDVVVLVAVALMVVMLLLSVSCLSSSNRFPTVQTDSVLFLLDPIHIFVRTDQTDSILFPLDSIFRFGSIFDKS